MSDNWFGLRPVAGHPSVEGFGTLLLASPPSLPGLTITGEINEDLCWRCETGEATTHDPMMDEDDKVLICGPCALDRWALKENYRDVLVLVANGSKIPPGRHVPRWTLRP